MEKDSILRLNQLHPIIRQDALDAYAEAVKTTPVGVHPFITQTYRTFAESNKLYAQGRTEPGAIVTNSKAGQSYHNFGLALDFVNEINGKIIWPNDPVNDKNWMIVVNCFKKRGFTWGGDFSGGFKDYPHLEKKLGYNWKQLLSMYNAGNNFIVNHIYLKLNDANTA